MSNDGVTSGPYFPFFRTEYGPAITPHLDTFHAVTESITDLLQSVTGITKCDKKLLRSVTSITRCDNYYKVRRNKARGKFLLFLV